MPDLKKRYLMLTAVILVVFAVGLVGFYMFSAPYGDGLESTMEKAGITEGEPLFNAPLGYGENYFASLIMGIVGFALTFLILAGIARLLRT